VAKVQSCPVIGCNDAYLFGSWVDVCLFIDAHWYWKHKEWLSAFQGTKVTTLEDLIGEPDINVMQNDIRGMSPKPSALAANTNTGAAAINLACHMGAKRILLTGFDMKLDPKTGQSNWHPNNLDKVTDEVFQKFRTWMVHVVAGLQQNFPDVEVLNATPGSALKAFPIVKLWEVL
jgi:hypothetical protein